MSCAACGARGLQLEQELLCPRCARVLGPQEEVSGKAGGARPYELGSYFGRPFMDVSRYPDGPRLLRLKALSDHAIRGVQSAHLRALEECLERACGALGLPRGVWEQALRKGMRLLRRKMGGELSASTPAIAAYSLLATLRELRLARVSWPELRRAFQGLGHRIRAAGLLRIRLQDQGGVLSLGIRDYVLRAPSALLGLEPVARALGREGLQPGSYERQLVREALKLLGLLDAVRLQGRSPRALAASLLYAAEVRLARQGGRGRLFTQGQAGAACGVAEYTVREVYSGLVRRLLEEAMGRAEQVAPLGQHEAQGPLLPRLHLVGPARRGIPSP